MGWLSKIGKAIEIAGLVAAPFTGGASTAVTGAAKAASIASKAGKVAAAVNMIGKVAGNASADRAAARVTEQGVNESADALALRRAAQAQTARSSDESSAVRGGLIEGLQDASIERPAGAGGRKMSGGLRPSAIVGKDAIGKKMKDDAMARLIAENSTPQLTERPSAGKFDKVLNLISGLAGASGIINNMRGQTPIPDVNTTVGANPALLAGQAEAPSGLDQGAIPANPLWKPKPSALPKFSSVRF